MWSGKAAFAPSPSTTGNFSMKGDGVFTSLKTVKKKKKPQVSTVTQSKCKYLHKYELRKDPCKWV